ncbi:AraC family transcriptional regulator [Buttiauxella agrestis]|nr:helix-turn-helix domain-containing protein [Buttiauxella agrestis]BCG10169.1 AraC family transcriptional regulator [Buttiauxella agrestis]
MINKLEVSKYFPDEQTKLSLYASDPEDNNCEHSHSFQELVIVEEGHGLHVINGKPIFIQQGDVFFIGENDVHFYDELGTLKLINILINPQLEFVYLTGIEQLLNRIAGNTAANYGWLTPETKAQCKRLINDIFHQQSSGAENQALKESLFFTLVTQIIYAQSQAEYSNTRYKLHKLLSYLQENCFNEIDWQQLANQFHLTQRTTSRHIKEVTGLTPENYLKRLRLVSARVKLKETDMTITEVAFLCGFTNSNHFTTSYKKVFGVTPSAERKRVER